MNEIILIHIFLKINPDHTTSYIIEEVGEDRHRYTRSQKISIQNVLLYLIDIIHNYHQQERIRPVGICFDLPCGHIICKPNKPIEILMY